MKKLLITIAMVFCAINVNAQWFLGGDVGLGVKNDNGNGSERGSSSGDERDRRDVDNTFNKTEINFSLSPKVGYYFNEKFALGLSFRLGGYFMADTTMLIEYDIPDYSYSRDIKEYNVEWGVYPFVRYSVFTYKKFSLLLEGWAGVRCLYSFHKTGNEKTEKGLTILQIGVLNVYPIVCFNLTERFQMEAGLNFLNLGYNINITKKEMGENTGTYKYTQHKFNTGFNSSGILAVSQLRFGIIYKF